MNWTNTTIDLSDSAEGPTVYGLVLTGLPYRLSVPRTLSLPVPKNSEHEVAPWVVNAVSFPPGTSIEDQLSAHHADAKLASFFVIEIRGGVEHLTNSPLRAEFRALSVLNDFVSLYNEQTTGPIIMGPGWGAPRWLSSRDYMAGRIVEARVLAEGQTGLSSTQVWDAVERLRPFEQTGRSGGAGDLCALPENELTKIVAGVSQIAWQGYRELFGRAKGAMLAGDELVALVLACAALEGVHAAWLRGRIRGCLAHEKRPDKTIDELLREQGIHTLLKVTPFAFADGDEPPAPLVEDALEGLRIRNNVLHAKVTRGGVYKFRSQDQEKSRRAYGAVMKLYRHFAVQL